MPVLKFDWLPNEDQEIKSHKGNIEDKYDLWFFQSKKLDNSEKVFCLIASWPADKSFKPRLYNSKEILLSDLDSVNETGNWLREDINPCIYTFEIMDDSSIQELADSTAKNEESTVYEYEQLQFFLTIDTEMGKPDEAFFYTSRALLDSDLLYRLTKILDTTKLPWNC